MQELIEAKKQVLANMGSANIRMFALVVLVAMALQMTACNKKDNSAARASQTIARVNGDEITVHQVNNELQRANVKPEQQEAAAKQIVQALIDRQVLVQAAIDAKMDRNPRVVQAIESAKAQILAQAYIDEKLSQVAKVTVADIAQYKTTHADVFADRKMYLMDELSLPLDAYSAELNAVADKAKSMAEIMQWLDEHGVKYNHQQVAHASETLPSPLLAELSKMKLQDIIFIRARQGNVIAQILQIKNAPAADDDTKKQVEQLIIAEKRKAIIEAEMKRLHEAAKVIYLDRKFEPAALSDKPPAFKKPQIETAEAVSTPKSESATNKPAANIEKGLSGL
ncbi:EpsD family peptidyl-prolyl cis-trans isomerase [Methylotenera mobilis]|uniref:Peptidyl-prolyl cis-trans isomerase, EpsD family n=1 Tax=Methylotenera mobilis (strain JLW8 / ATCC BAA-1282 / DSM 17540) TaxID=583345 RepID=C6WXQ2_METML|nr:EpsD family peptidyl-prolyl cis-trans isomerase [Methylotenera mobilis]ACT48701.1 peptidyl-prolyl cis-trans isomerase, EpsD family [Methylotenera mobilis JLW8]